MRSASPVAGPSSSSAAPSSSAAGPSNPGPKTPVGQAASRGYLTKKGNSNCSEILNYTFCYQCALCFQVFSCVLASMLVLVIF